MERELCEQVMHLQSNLTALTAFDGHTNTSVTLKDICYMPLYPATQECTILSVIGYFQVSPLMYTSKHMNVSEQ